MRDSCLLKDTGESLRGVYIHGVFCALALRPRAPFQSSANSAHPSFRKQILALLCPGLGFSGHGHRASSPSAILKALSAFKYLIMHNAVLCLIMHNAVLCRRVVKIVITIICKGAWVLTSMNRTQLWYAFHGAPFGDLFGSLSPSTSSPSMPQPHFSLSLPPHPLRECPPR